MRSYKEQKELIRSLITQISNFYGKDEMDFLEEYCEELINKYTDDLETAISCFEDVARLAGLAKLAGREDKNGF